jgi:hypothetical protein
MDGYRDRSQKLSAKEQKRISAWPLASYPVSIGIDKRRIGKSDGFATARSLRIQMHESFTG